FDTSRCLICGNPENIERLPSLGGFWFCSQEHYVKAVKTYLPKEFASEEAYRNDSEWSNAYERWQDAPWDETQEDADRLWREIVTAVFDKWLVKYEGALALARQKLRVRLLAESDRQREEQAEKDRIAAEKEVERQQAQAERDRIRRERDEERQQREW